MRFINTAGGRGRRAPVRRVSVLAGVAVALQLGTAPLAPSMWMRATTRRCRRAPISA